MPKKPDKFGIKFGLLVDACSNYLCNDKSYHGRDPTRDGEKNLPTDFCLWLMQPFLKKGYNVIINNYFTSINLANKIKVEKTTLLGTIRKKKKKVPKVEVMTKGKPLYASAIYQSPSNATLSIYCIKQKNKS